MRKPNVTLWTCDAEKGHSFDYDRMQATTEDADALPDGWVSVDVAALPDEGGGMRHFCSVRCAYLALMDMAGADGAREVA